MEDKVPVYGPIFIPGDKVVSPYPIEEWQSSVPDPRRLRPERGKVYTVRDYRIEEAFNKYDQKMYMSQFLMFVELDNRAYPVPGDDREEAFHSLGFRKAGDFGVCVDLQNFRTIVCAE